MMFLRGFFIFIFAALLVSSAVYAQDETQDETVAEESVEESENQAVSEEKEVEATENKDFLSNENPYIADMVLRSQLRDKNSKRLSRLSLFFTPGELNLIRDAEKGLVSRPVTETEIKEAEKEIAQNIRPPRGPREIEMGGIIYQSENDWAVWINGQKITPDRIPEEILDIRVYRDTVQLKWFDAYTNQVFPVKMKSHQRFNIDTRIFLPG